MWPGDGPGAGLQHGQRAHHPELVWREAETPLFRIVYPAHLAGIEVEAAAVAEVAYAALSANLGVTFGVGA
ncbi:hypothetical protein GQ464_007465 [Rhodocaloribacter litoris]|uniref:hypothetical protein n=1 Tax=Rhodocaloribacter litoris TaxID=2558931 RepID=UPI001E53DCCA|nr:hypothetical protein [Rhodocaloribacter litoris]QXD16767.1 hypothetical protein GQ464_007465 [Rhodocaloribacter litoris]